MTKAESSKELKELGNILADVKKRVANQIPILVEMQINDRDLSNVTDVLTSLSRCNRYLINAAAQLGEEPPKSSH